DRGSGGMAILLRNGVWAALLSVGILPLLLGAYLRSFEAVPAGSLGALAMSVSEGEGQRAFEFVHAIIRKPFRGNLPLAARFLLVDVCFGFLGKILNGASVQGEAFLTKTVLGLLLLVMMLHTDIGNSLLHFALTSLLVSD